MVPSLNQNGRSLKSSTRRKRRRAPWRIYRLPIEPRALLAARLIDNHGWTIRRASAAVGVCTSYVFAVKGLGTADRLRIDRGQLKLSTAWQNYVRELAAKRALAVAAQFRTVDDILGSVEVDRVVDHFGVDRLMAALDRATAPTASAVKPNGNGAAASHVHG